MDNGFHKFIYTDGNGSKIMAVGPSDLDTDDIVRMFYFHLLGVGYPKVCVLNSLRGIAQENKAVTPKTDSIL